MEWKHILTEALNPIETEGERDWGWGEGEWNFQNTREGIKTHFRIFDCVQWPMAMPLTTRFFRHFVCCVNGRQIGNL